MLITTQTFSKIANKPVNSNMISAMKGLEVMGNSVGLHRPHRLAMFLAQTAHESMGWVHDREIWGPTPTQVRYEGRADLGNNQPGDGSLFRGYTPMQITGRYNTTLFYNWCKSNNLNPPDFTKQPHLMNTDPWEGLGPLWYWAYGKPTSLNISADRGDFVTNTRLVNGKTKGINDRYRYYGRAALVLLGEPMDIKAFQIKHKLGADGVVGPKTQLVMHKLLEKLQDVTFTDKPVTSKPTPIITSKPKNNTGIVTGGILVAIIAATTYMFWG